MEMENEVSAHRAAYLNNALRATSILHYPFFIPLISFPLA